MGEAIERLELKLTQIYVPPHVRVTDGKRVHVDGYWREGQRIKLYRGEGDHDAPSYYEKSGPNAQAGAWWTTDLKSAQRYAAGSRNGKVYEIEAEEGSEAEAHGLPGYYVISDPKVRERRKALPSLPKWEYDPRDTRQQRALLEQKRSAQKVRARYPVGTRVIVVPGVGLDPRPDAGRGTVDRHIPGGTAQGGQLIVNWDSGTSGRITPVNVIREDGR